MKGTIKWIGDVMIAQIEGTPADLAKLVNGLKLDMAGRIKNSHVSLREAFEAYRIWTKNNYSRDDWFTVTNKPSVLRHRKSTAKKSPTKKRAPGRKAGKR